MASTVTAALIVRASTCSTRPRGRSSAAVVVVTSPRSGITGRTTLPRLRHALATLSFDTVLAMFDGSARCVAAADLRHEGVELALANTFLVVTGTRTTVISPGLADLTIGTVAGHMSSLATDAADDASGEVLLLWAVVLPMSDLTTVLARLVLVVTEGTVEGGELTELVALQLVLAFWNGGSLEYVSMCRYTRKGNIPSQ
jgi:hypothetical protein